VGSPKTALLLGIAVDWPLTAPASRWPEHGYAHLAGAAERFGIRVALFHIAAVDWRKAAVDGWVRAGRGKWTKQRLPLPDAVYNRISRRRVEASVPGRRALWRLSRRVPLFNPRFLNKAEVQAALAASPASRFLPAAAVAAGAGAIARAVDQFGAAYVKPVNGALGRGILRAERAGRHYRIVHNPRRGFSSPLVRARVSRSQLNALFQNLYRDEPVLVQEAVGALRVHGRPADIRALVQKDPGGAWRLTGAAGRVAAPGGVTTHTVRGGQAVPYGRLAEEAGGALPGLDVLERAAVDAARAVEQAFGDGFFELSLDMAVREDGTPAILEVNAKPFPFDEPAIRRLAAERLFLYARARAAAGVLPQPSGTDLVSPQ